MFFGIYQTPSLAYNHVGWHCVFQLSKVATTVQTTDTTQLRTEIFNYLQPSDKFKLGFDIPHFLPKDERGLENLTTARFLIPRKHLDEFEANPHG